MHQPNGTTRGRGNSSDQITRPLAAALCLAMGVLWGCETPAKVQEPEPQAEPESVGQDESALRFDSGRRLLGYYAQWAIYGGHGTYNPCMVPFTKYTYINYAFVGVRTTANP